MNNFILESHMIKDNYKIVLLFLQSKKPQPICERMDILYKTSMQNIQPNYIHGQI